MRDQAVTDGEQHEGLHRIGRAPAQLKLGDGEPANHIDDGDDDARDRIAAHELRRTVHRAVKVGLARNLITTPARFLLVDGAGGEIGVDGHLLARHRVEGESRGNLRHAGGTLGDHHELHDHQNDEDDRADEGVGAGDEVGERLDDMAGGGGGGLGILRFDGKDQAG